MEIIRQGALFLGLRFRRAFGPDYGGPAAPEAHPALGLRRQAPRVDTEPQRSSTTTAAFAAVATAVVCATTVNRIRPC